MARINEKSSDKECAYAAKISSELAKNSVPIEESRHCPNCGSRAVDFSFFGYYCPDEEFGKY